MSEVNITTTKGPFFVRPTRTELKGFLAICQAETEIPIALVMPKNGVCNWADAAALATQPHAMEALIAIQDMLMNAAQPIDREEMLDIISQVFEKIAAESDVDA